MGQEESYPGLFFADTNQWHCGLFDASLYCICCSVVVGKITIKLTTKYKSYFRLELQQLLTLQWLLSGPLNLDLESGRFGSAATSVIANLGGDC